MTKHYSYGADGGLVPAPTADALIEAGLAYGRDPAMATSNAVRDAADAYHEAHDCCDEGALAERVQALEHTQRSLCDNLRYQERRLDNARKLLSAREAALLDTVVMT